MISENFKGAIKIISERLEGKQIKWAVIGSVNLALQGMDVVPRDLDIVVERLDDLKKIPEIFSEYFVFGVEELKSMTEEPAWEVKLNIGGVEVHVLGEKDTGEYVRKFLDGRLTHVKIDDIKVLCFTLEAEAQAYEETNRKHKAELIRKFLKKQGK